MSIRFAYSFTSDIGKQSNKVILEGIHEKLDVMRQKTKAAINS